MHRDHLIDALIVAGALVIALLIYWADGGWTW